ncbi:MAG: ankyrin repeat domain-containing protein, partial [Ekhidna sp.]|nr:ankyrin repeat domain-containing protein [Ekhidna sp.]
TLDFEITQSYTLTISVSDGKLSATADVTVNVTDVNDNAPTIAPEQAFSVPEDAVNGTAVGTVQASDAETNNLTFSITQGNTGNVFAIGEGTGAITVAGSLDFETAPIYTLKVSVSDGSLSVTADITINVTDVDETATTRKEIAGLLSTLEDTQDGHLQTTGITNAQMKLAALKMESPATAATYKAAIDAIVAVEELTEETIMILQGEIDAITQKITALENAGNAPAGTLQPLKDDLEARKTAQKVLSNGASGLTTELRKITVSEETKTMALRTELNKLSPDWDVILMLISEGADVNAKNNSGRTVLMLSIINGQTAAANALLNVSGIMVNIKDISDNTALMLAVVNDRIATVNALLKVDGIEVNAKNNQSNTALHLAAINGYIAVVEALLKVDDIEVNAKNNAGNTALILAVFFGHTAIVNALLNADGIEVNIIGGDNKTAFDRANDLSDSDDKTATITAIRNAGGKTKAELDRE